MQKWAEFVRLETIFNHLLCAVNPVIQLNSLYAFIYLNFMIKRHRRLLVQFQKCSAENVTQSLTLSIKLFMYLNVHKCT